MTSQIVDRPQPRISVPVYMKVREAAEYMHVSAEFLRREIRNKRGPIVSRFGRGKRHTYRILYDDLMRWAQQKRKES